MSWIYAEHCVDNTRIFLLLLCSTYTESRHFLSLTPPARWLGMHKKLGGDAATAALTQGIAHNKWSPAQHSNLGGEERFILQRCWASDQQRDILMQNDAPPWRAGTWFCGIHSREHLHSHCTCDRGWEVSQTPTVSTVCLSRYSLDNIIITS